MLTTSEEVPYRCNLYTDQSSNKIKTKKKIIEYCLNDTYIDLWQLRELALMEGGLLNGECEIEFLVGKIKLKQRLVTASSMAIIDK